MEKYDLLTITNYYNGNDTDPYTTDELENDSFFMRCVMHQFRDKNMYNFASDKVKKSYRYVDQLIDLFPDDIAFLKKAVMNYVDAHDVNPHKALKLLIKLNNLVSIKKDVIGGLHISLLTTTKFFETWIPRMFEDDESMFDYMVEFYKNMYDDNSRNQFIVVDYYAKDLIKDYLGKTESETETLIQQNFSCFNDFKKYGFYNFFISLIKSENQSLAEYIKLHRYLLDDYIRTLPLLEKKWDSIIKQNEDELYRYIFTEVHCYVEYDACDCPLSENELLAAAGRELNILDKLKEHDAICNYDNHGHDYIGMMLDDECYDISCIKDARRHITKVKYIISNILRYKTVEEYEEYLRSLDCTLADCSVSQLTNYTYSNENYKGISRTKEPCKVTGLELNCTNKNN